MASASGVSMESHTNQAMMNPKWQKPLRQRLRTESTSAESTLWLLLKGRKLDGMKWRRQHGIGPYIVDFYCPSARLAIELDGAVHDSPEAAEYDDARTRHLMASGVRVLRFENRVVFEQPTDVLQAIRSEAARPPAPEAVGGSE